MTTHTTGVLALCPFCGCKRARVNVNSVTAYVGCTRCAACGPEVEIAWKDDTEGSTAGAEAIRLWQSRK